MLHSTHQHICRSSIQLRLWLVVQQLPVEKEVLALGDANLYEGR